MNTNRNIAVLLVAFATFLAASGAAHAQVITQWNFNSNPADANTSTGTTTPSTGAGTLSLAGGITSTFSTGSPGDPAPTVDNSALNTLTYPAQGTNSGKAGVAFAVDTTGFTNIQISLDFRQSGTASRYFQLLVSSDGTTFSAPSGGTTSIGTINTGNTLTSFSSTGLYTNNAGGGTQTFVQGITYTLAPGSVYENDSKFAFEWVSVFDQSGTAPGSYISSNAGTAAAYTTAGTARFDEVTITSVPEPGGVCAGLCLGGLVVAGVTRRFLAARGPAAI